jgi:outer membrane lipoprotein SlyB
MNSSSISKGIMSAALLAAIAGCTSQRPVLYPNAKYNQVGEAAARQDIDDCLRLAEQAGAAQGGGNRAAKAGVEGAAAGFVTGAVAGAIVGGNVFTAAVAGAAVIAGAAAGTHSAIHADEPSDLRKNFVQRCLSEGGYDVIGWQ